MNLTIKVFSQWFDVQKTVSNDDLSITKQETLETGPSGAVNAQIAAQEQNSVLIHHYGTGVIIVSLTKPKDSSEWSCCAHTKTWDILFFLICLKKSNVSIQYFFKIQ